MSTRTCACFIRLISEARYAGEGGGLGLEERDAPGAVEVRGRHAPAPKGSKGGGEPRLVVQADPHDEGGALQGGEASRCHLDGVWILTRRRQRLHAHALPAHFFEERLEICGGGHDGERAAAPRGSGGPPCSRGGGPESEGGAEERPQHQPTSWR